MLFRSNNQWRAKPITPDDERLFQDALARLNVGHPISHASYLINLASPDPALWRKSVDAMIVELRRAEQLGIPFVVVHPGSHTTASADDGIASVARALDDIHEQAADLTARCLLENTAGQGSNLGWQFEQLAAILKGVAQRTASASVSTPATLLPPDIRSPTAAIISPRFAPSTN